MSQPALISQQRELVHDLLGDCLGRGPVTLLPLPAALQDEGCTTADRLRRDLVRQLDGLPGAGRG